MKIAAKHYSLFVKNHKTNLIIRGVINKPINLIVS